MTVLDSMSLAAEAGLRYISDEEPGLRRLRRGRGFTYVDPQGTVVNGRARKRIDAMAIPPAWERVWISADPTGHIQATGIDAAGRKQYIYHPDWEVIRDEAKFDRMTDFGRSLPALRKRVDRDLSAPGLTRVKVTALAVAVLDRTLIRVGNRKYASNNDAYGLTTLTTDHVDVSGHEVRLEFAGKGGADHQLVFKDRRLAGLIGRCEELAGQTLFSYPTADGSMALTSTDVNLYLGETMSGPFTAKDFRTWGASATVVETLARAGHEDEEKSILEAIDTAAEKLGNTRAVCRTSYVHPLIPDAYRQGTLIEAWRRSRTGLWLGRPESTVNRLLGGYLSGLPAGG
jgi:DNA topoisomerase-1